MGSESFFGIVQYLRGDIANDNANTENGTYRSFLSVHIGVFYQYGVDFDVYCKYNKVLQVGGGKIAKNQEKKDKESQRRYY